MNEEWMDGWMVGNQVRSYERKSIATVSSEESKCMIEAKEGIKIFDCERWCGKISNEK